MLWYSWKIAEQQQSLTHQNLSTDWGERWLFVLLNLVELFKLSFHNIQENKYTNLQLARTVTLCPFLYDDKVNIFCLSIFLVNDVYMNCDNVFDSWSLLLIFSLTECKRRWSVHYMLLWSNVCHICSVWSQILQVNNFLDYKSKRTINVCHICSVWSQILQVNNFLDYKSKRTINVCHICSVSESTIWLRFWKLSVSLMSNWSKQ